MIKLKVMTYNIHICHPISKESTFRDIDAIARVIREVDPDLVALQEVDRYTKRSGIDIDQAKELGKRTGLYQTFIKATEFYGGDYGNAILSKYPLSNVESILLPSIDNKGEVRSAGIATIELPDISFHFVATHLAAWHEESRIHQAKQLLHVLDALEKPTIFAGDWNAEPHSETVRLIEKTFTSTCAKNTYPLTFPSHQPQITIDYIVFKPSHLFRVIHTYAVPEAYASDHFPFVTELEVRPSIR